MSLRIGRAHSLFTRLYFLLTVPISIFFILSSTKIDPRYKLSHLAKLRLGLGMLRNTLRIPTGSSFKVHLAMALKLFELPPDRAGAVVECGSWKGGSAANLSLVCQLTGRTLEIFDSFAGLPPGEPTDREAQHYRPGDYAGSLHEVRENLEKYGALDCCHFNQGWFHETLPTVNYPIALAFLDVDYEASLDVCVRNIWPHLIEGGYIFVDECATLDYVSLFYSESWWRAAFDQTPPGLIGAGTGLALGEYYIGPWSERSEHPLQHITTGAYTQKGMSAYWAYRPAETPAPSEV
jgi:O-methyltransferase